MTELSHEARMLVEQGRSSDAANASDRARIRGRLVGELGAGAFATAAVTSVALSSGQASVMVGGAAASAATGATSAVQRASYASSFWLKAAAAFVAVGGGALLYVANVSPGPHTAERAAGAPHAAQAFAVQREQADALPSSDGPRAATALAQAQPESVGQAASGTARHANAEPRAEARSAAVTGENNSEAPTASATARARSKRARAAAETSVADLPNGQGERAASTPAVRNVAASTVSVELALLARAQRALREGRAREALTLTDEHAAQFSQSGFTEERAGIETLARCMLGERREANARAFLERAPSSPLAARVRKECGLE